MTEETTNTEATKTEEVKKKPGRPANPRTAIFKDIEAERKAQDDKWGEQDHPQQGGLKPAGAIPVYSQRADDWKGINDRRVKDDVMGWDSILIEEVYEALGEVDPEARRAELVQVTAVAVHMIEKIDQDGEAA